MSKYLMQNVDSITNLLHLSFQTRDLKTIKKLHAHLLRTGLLFISLTIHTKIISAYATFLHKTNLQAPTKFLSCIKTTNPLPFNLILSEFCRNGYPYLALKTMSFMHFNAVHLDTYALCSSLSASSSIKAVEFGLQVHAYVEKSGWLSSVFVGSALIDIYAKTSFISSASIMFNEMPLKNTVCANALLSGLADAKLWIEGIKLGRKMHQIKIEYDHFSLSAILRSCAGLSAIELGKQVHAKLIRTVFDVKDDFFLQSSLIEMYGKCGSVEKSLKVFHLNGFEIERAEKRDVVLWTSLLGVYGRNGHHKEVIKLYKKMLMEGIKPDEVVLVTVISACSHTGQVKLGLEYFYSMVHKFGLAPCSELYGCVVDMLCRAGELEKAWRLIKEIDHKRNEILNVSSWGALLSACDSSGNIELGVLAAERALKLDPQNVGIYILLSNLYAKFGMWDEIRKVRELMKERGLRKDIGCSWIETTS